MNKKAPIIYYSINTYLSNLINKEYYNDIHFVYVAPCFNCSINPRSSNPSEIYSELVKDLNPRTLDYHSAKIKSNRLGIIKGAIIKEKEGLIDEETKNIIVELSKKADLTLFEPLIYIIPANLINNSRLNTPNFTLKAGNTSKEYIIKDLNSSEFDIIKL